MLFTKIEQGWLILGLLCHHSVIQVFTAELLHFERVFHTHCLNKAVSLPRLNFNRVSRKSFHKKLKIKIYMAFICKQNKSFNSVCLLLEKIWKNNNFKAKNNFVWIFCCILYLFFKLKQMISFCFCLSHCLVIATNLSGLWRSTISKQKMCSL